MARALQLLHSNKSFPTLIHPYLAHSRGLRARGLSNHVVILYVFTLAKKSSLDHVRTLPSFEGGGSDQSAMCSMVGVKACGGWWKVAHKGVEACLMVSRVCRLQHAQEHSAAEREQLTVTFCVQQHPHTHHAPWVWMVKKKGKDGGKNEASDPSAPPAPPKPTITELLKIETESYLLQIKDLTEKLDRQKRDNDNLTTQFEKLKRADAEERENIKDIMEFLKVQLAGKQKELAEYETRLRLNAHDSDVATASLQTQLHIQQDISQQTILSLQEELKKMKEELEELNEFKAQKADIENELEDLKLARENDRCLHKERLHEVEREVLKEKDKLLKEKDQQVREIRENLLNLSKANLDKTTKLTIMENDQITAELAYQAKQTIEMVEQNKKLATENVELKRKMELMTQIEKDLSKKNTSNQKTIKSLQAKIQSLETEMNDQTNKLGKEISLLKEELRDRDEQISDLENSSTELISLREERERAQNTIREALQEMEDSRGDIKEILTATLSAFEDLHSSTIELLMQAESSQRTHDTINFYEFSDNLENAMALEKEKVIKFISEKVRTDTKEAVPDIKRNAFPPIRAISIKTENLKTSSPNTPTWDSTAKIYLGFAAPLPPAPTRAKRTPNKETKPGSPGLKELVSVGVQTDSVEKNIFLMEKWMKENKMQPPSRVNTSRYSAR